MLYFMCVFFVFFFFKQKTAYEMRISDWSSDVCSSDLGGVRRGAGGIQQPGQAQAGLAGKRRVGVVAHRVGEFDRAAAYAGRGRQRPGQEAEDVPRDPHQVHGRVEHGVEGRSEEHTSELQSLMRISYAVFCLKKKTNKNIERRNAINVMS